MSSRLCPGPIISFTSAIAPFYVEEMTSYAGHPFSSYSQKDTEGSPEQFVPEADCIRKSDEQVKDEAHGSRASPLV